MAPETTTSTTPAPAPTTTPTTTTTTPTTTTTTPTTTTTTPTETTTLPPTMPYKEIGKTTKNKEYIIFDNYEYWFHRKNVDGTIWWRCSKVIRCHCRVRIKTDPKRNIIVVPKFPHNHAGSNSAVLNAKKVITKMMCKVNDEPTKLPSQIHGAILQDLSEDIHRAMPTQVALTRRIQRHRKKLRQISNSINNNDDDNNNNNKRNSGDNNDENNKRNIADNYDMNNEDHLSNKTNSSLNNKRADVDNDKNDDHNLRSKSTNKLTNISASVNELDDLNLEILQQFINFLLNDSSTQENDSAASDSESTTNRIVMFGRLETLKNLEKSKGWPCRGTFPFSSDLSYQIYDSDKL